MLKRLLALVLTLSLVAPPSYAGLSAQPWYIVGPNATLLPVLTGLTVHGVTYTWPTSDASGCLQDDGSGNLSWVTCNNGITQLTGDVTAGPGSGSVASTVAKIQGTTVTGTTGSGKVVLNNAPTMAGAINMGSNKITSVTDPTSAQDAATKNYVDTVASGLNPLQAVYAASTANVAGTYLNGVACVGATFTTTATTAFALDGTSPPLNSRILLKDQSSGFQNGVYTLTTQAVNGVSGAILTRALDYNTAADVNAGDLIPVENGTANIRTSWLQTATVTTCGSDSLTFTKWTYDPLGALTPSSVAVTGSSGTPLTVNTTDLVVDSTNHSVGVGVAPGSLAVLDVVNQSGSTKAIQTTGYGSNVGFRGRQAQGTMGSPTATQTGDTLSFFSGRGYGATAFASGATGIVNINADGNFSDTSMPTYIAVSTTPSASVTSAERMRVSSGGNVLIGTTTDDGSTKLQVNGNISASTVTASLTGHASLDLPLTGGTITGAMTNSVAGALSTPASSFTGSPITGGSGTTTTPLFRMEDAASAATSWNTSGTYIGVNAKSGFTGDLFNVSVNNTPEFRVNANGTITTPGTVQCTNVSTSSSNTVLHIRQSAAPSGSSNTTVADIMSGGTDAHSNGVLTVLDIIPTYNQTSTAGATDLRVNRTETAVGTGTQRLADFQVGGTSYANITNKGALNLTQNGLTSAPVLNISGSPFTGGTGTTTMPLLTVASAASTAWSTAGTMIGANAPSGFTGNLIDLQLNGAGRLTVDSTGTVTTNGTINATNGSFRAAASGTTMLLQSSRNLSAAGTNVSVMSGGTASNSSGTATIFSIVPTYNQTSTAAGTDFLVNRTETAVGSGAQLLMDLQVGGTSKYNIDDKGHTNRGGAAFTVTCNGNAGSSIVGNDGAGGFTAPATPGTSCVVTFASTWVHKAICSATNETGGRVLPMIGNSGGTTATITDASLTASDVLSFSCTTYI